MTTAPGTRQSPRHGELLIPFLTVLFDAVSIECAFLFAYWIRFHSSLLDSLGFVAADAPPFAGYLTGSVVVTLVWLMLFNARRMYRIRRSVSLSDEFLNIVTIVSLGMLIVMSAAFFYRDFSYSRVVFGLLWVLSILFIATGRAVIHQVERRRYRQGRHVKNGIIIGRDAITDDVFSRLHHHPAFGFSIIGYFADLPVEEWRPLAHAPHLGTLSDVPEYILHHHIELAFIALRAPDHRRLFDLITECEGVNVEFMMVPDVLEILTSQVRVEELEGIPFLKIKSIPLTGWGRITKRVFDIAVSAAVLLVLSPLWILIAVLITLTSRGPVLFTQDRVGLDGRRFVMYKFRSMKTGSELLDTSAGLGIRHDPRRTRIGVILRKTSLDELPQLLNVLKGDMSLVGPRPERIHYVKEFGESVPRYLDRHRVKTGMTGWAQVNGLRGDTSIKERIKYDLYYIENWSLTFDIKILLRTLRAALATREVH
jgi:Undecaprenyl-phosphate glucose phosphotransferase